MGMVIIKATDAIEVKHPVTLVFGPPGIGKSALLFMGKTLTLDFDKGAHRAGNRKDTIQPESWNDVEEMLASPAKLEAYEIIGIDTVGRCLDLITIDIIDKTPKHAYDGALNQKGWGVLKSRFHTFLARLRAMGKDVVMVAHDREDKDSEPKCAYPDIQGGSYGEVLKSADFVGYLSLAGKERALDFNPTERHVGKNPAAWSLIKVPDFAKQPDFLAGLIAKGRETLGRIGAESAMIAGQIADWAAQMETFTTPDEATAVLPKIEALEPMLRAQVKALLWERVKGLYWTYSPEKKAFVAASKPPSEAPKAPTEEMAIPGFGG